MARPPKYPFARYAASHELYVFETDQPGGGLAAIERVQSAAHTYAKRHGLACKTAKTIVVGPGDDPYDGARFRGAVQFAPKLLDKDGRFPWAACFETVSNGQTPEDRAHAEHATTERYFKVCEHCLIERDPRPGAHDCDHCAGCDAVIGLTVGPRVDVHPIPSTASGADIPPPAPENVSPDSESDVPQPEPEPEPDLASAPDLFGGAVPEWEDPA